VWSPQAASSPSRLRSRVPRGIGALYPAVVGAGSRVESGCSCEERAGSGDDISYPARGTARRRALACWSLGPVGAKRRPPERVKHASGPCSQAGLSRLRVVGGSGMAWPAVSIPRRALPSMTGRGRGRLPAGLGARRRPPAELDSRAVCVPAWLCLVSSREPWLPAAGQYTAPGFAFTDRPGRGVRGSSPRGREDWKWFDDEVHEQMRLSAQAKIVQLLQFGEVCMHAIESSDGG
jgi:hypothetical protein